MGERWYWDRWRPRRIPEFMVKPKLSAYAQARLRSDNPPRLRIDPDDLLPIVGDSPCFAADMTNLDNRRSHILCHKPKGHEGDHGNDLFTWPVRPGPSENGETDNG